MKSIEKLRNLITQGVLQEEDLPIGVLKNEARARRFLQKWEEEQNTSPEIKAYDRLIWLHKAIRGVQLLNAKREEGKSGEFLGALAGETLPNQTEDKDLYSEALDLVNDEVYGYSKFVGDREMMGFIYDLLKKKGGE